MASNILPLSRSRRALAVLPVLMALAACSPRLDWREIKAADGRWTVALPDKPQVATRDIRFEGATLPMTMTSTGVGATLFAVGEVALPAAALATAESRAAAIDRFREALLANFQMTAATVAAAAPVLPAGSSARPLAGQAVSAVRDGPDGRLRLAARFYVADDRLYQLVAFGRDTQLGAEAVDTFFTSFRLQR